MKVTHVASQDNNDLEKSLDLLEEPEVMGTLVVAFP